MRWTTPAVVVQMRAGIEGEIRVGYTASAKVGIAVKRNRAKRRLREAVKEVFGKKAKAGFDYVLIARAPKIFDITYDDLCKDLTWALKKLYEEQDKKDN